MVWRALVEKKRGLPLFLILLTLTISDHRSTLVPYMLYEENANSTNFLNYYKGLLKTIDKADPVPKGTVLRVVTRVQWQYIRGVVKSH